MITLPIIKRPAGGAAIAVTVIGVVALVLAGCGGGKESAETAARAVELAADQEARSAEARSGEREAAKRAANRLAEAGQAEARLAEQSLRVGKRAIFIDDFVPTGWRKIASALGDLNKDNATDAAIVIEEINPANKTGAPGFNPRAMLVLLRDGDNYTLAEKSGAGKFMPTGFFDNDACLIDPLASGGIEIARGVIRVVFDYRRKREPNCAQLQGSNLYRLIFRYQNNRFELIGADYEKFLPQADGQSSVSVNFSTMEMERTTPTAGMEKEKIDISARFVMEDFHHVYPMLERALAENAPFSASGKDAAGRDVRLIGVWVAGGLASHVQYTFRQDGSFESYETMKSGSTETGTEWSEDTQKGTWHTKGNVLTIALSDGTTLSVHDYYLDGRFNYGTVGDWEKRE